MTSYVFIMRRPRPARASRGTSESALAISMILDMPGNTYSRAQLRKLPFADLADIYKKLRGDPD
jgi:hypothetical protein